MQQGLNLDMSASIIACNWLAMNAEPLQARRISHDGPSL